MNARLPVLTAKERRAMEDEINRQTAQNVKKLSADLQALVLWQLHEQLGFGKRRLLRFQKSFAPMLQELQRFYEVRSAHDTDFICKYKLKQEVGIDVEELDEMFQFNVVMRKGGE
jgi:hypothetical protein